MPIRSERLGKGGVRGGPLNQAGLCSPLACGLIKKTRLIPAGGGITDVRNQDPGALNRQRCFESEEERTVFLEVTFKLCLEGGVGGGRLE